MNNHISMFMRIADRIEWHPEVCNGKPVIRGTRIPAGIILEQIAEGVSWEQLLYDYPELSSTLMMDEQKLSAP